MTTTTTTTTMVPTIRLDHPDKTAVVQQLRTVCINKGFFYLSGHGIDPTLLHNILHDAAPSFFALPTLEKMALHDSVLNRGYTALGAQTLDPQHQRRPDTKEGFIVGGTDVERDHPTYDVTKFRGPNPWPAVELTPSWTATQCASFRQTVTAYRQECLRVSHELAGLLALAVGLDDEKFFEPFCRDPIANLRLLRYSREPSDPDNGVLACGAHTDWGLLTLLLTDENRGLQIYTKNNDKDGALEWMDVPPDPSCFVVNLGDLLERWTNGLFQSPLHRVVTPPPTREGSVVAQRFSVPFFFDPDVDAVVKVLDVCCSPEKPAMFPPTTCGQYIQDKFQETHNKKHNDEG